MENSRVQRENRLNLTRHGGFPKTLPCHAGVGLKPYLAMAFLILPWPAFGLGSQGLLEPPSLLEMVRFGMLANKSCPQGEPNPFKECPKWGLP